MPLLIHLSQSVGQRVWIFMDTRQFALCIVGIIKGNSAQLHQDSSPVLNDDLILRAKRNVLGKINRRLYPWKTTMKIPVTWSKKDGHYQIQIEAMVVIFLIYSQYMNILCILRLYLSSFIDDHVRPPQLGCLVNNYKQVIQIL